MVVKLNHAGIRELLKSEGVQGDLDRRAGRVAAQAKSTAPVDHGDYRDGIETRRNPTPNRARAEVVAGDPKSTIIEARTRNLGKAIDAARDGI